ncbi:oxygenase MpaB family protein [Streptomyces racemochromogenes]|uniref:Oxygenase MpaB family protein n=1 Tax=Streptomyces racemochromogenes TaxID=67353 RepID=A0ABW7P7T7_9ACTN
MTSVDLPAVETLLRRTLGERRMGLVAWRLLVMQIAHPVVAAGMDRYSTYRAHPWRRIEHTMESGSRLFFAGPEERRLEVARLGRTHRRIHGTDAAGRAYSAEDPEVRGWVMVTLYESMTAMRELSGDPLSPAERDVLYGEFLDVCTALGIPGEVLPASAADVPGYVERMVGEVLEYGPEVHDMLHGMLRQAPVPRRLGRLAPAWPVLRVVIARAVAALTVSDLPPAWHKRFGTSRGPVGAALSWTLHHGLRHAMELAPDRVRYRQRSVSGAPTPARVPASRARSGGDTRPARLEAFFRQVLDQTGNGRVDSADLQAMVHTMCWRLELPTEREDELYAAFEGWWRQLREAADTDGDGGVDCREFVSAMTAGVDRDPAYLEKGLVPAVRALFRAADADGSGRLGADEYRALFGGPRVHPAELNDGFRAMDADGDGQVGEEEFVAAFCAFFTARSGSVAGAGLLGRA